MTAIESTQQVPRPRKGVGIVDCDVHNVLAARDELEPYLASRFHPYYRQVAGRTPGGMSVGARPNRGIYREDSRPAGGPPGSDLELLREQLLDRWDVRRAILSPLEILQWVQHGEVGQAFCAALNDWQIDRWMERDARLFGSIVVPSEDGERAAAEIARSAADPRFVQVLVVAGSGQPLGHPRYWPIYEAAVAHGLPLVIHVGGFSGTQSAAGWFSFHAERHTAWTGSYQAQVVSLVYSGAFKRFPKLQVVLEEGGLAWMPSLMWRLDRAWASLHADVPHLEEPPSDVIRRHFWFTTQPMDEPERPEQLLETLEHLAMDDRIMFASDYPHWDFDPPDRTLSPTIGRERRDRIFRWNAESLFPFPGDANQ